MTTRQDEVLKETLHRMAGRVTDADPAGERLAGHALRGAERRRTRRIAAGTTAGVAAITLASIAVAGGGRDRAEPEAVRPVTSGSPTHHLRLPSNTAAERAVVRACMTTDPDVPDITAADDPGEMTGPGTRIADFRVLVTYRDPLGQAVLLGSTVAHRTCDLDTRGRPTATDRMTHQTANAWQPSLSSATRVISLDDGREDILHRSDMTGDDKTPHGVQAEFAGRVRPDVTRVTFTLPDGRTSDAAVAHGFFLWRKRTDTPVPVRDLSPYRTLVIRAYDHGGRLLTTVRTQISAALAGS
ncbi:hypothetical protein [Actinoallomurus soli]|uniref:hypothetical protein n=1 Tax=Actinoallomurus soli TaxID=2952535 RepID=UPI0020920CA7|nr:hypothetical protein [Actinoallomurus soli]MCO5968097.1 hypothetical protein [Actinoallomurus soli]